ncbi:hypothetical protein FDECE_12069 [Fusarium decemcellulare]|nr:hypothetical protein FDECE_12069 [Fusarium decemcellulare]
MAYNIVRCLTAALLVSSASVQAAPADSADATRLVERATFRDDFNTFNTDTWSCEYTCPLIEGAKARYRLRSGVEPDNEGSWSKSRYKPKRFTSGKFTVSFSLTERPTEQPVWWGVALWDETYGKDNFNEINFGYTTNQEGLGDTQLRFESAKRGDDDYLVIETGVDLYDEQYHTATLEYDSAHVAFYLDGRKLGEFTNTSIIPTDPMDFIIGPRLVTGGDPLTKGFTQSVDWVEIEY